MLASAAHAQVVERNLAPEAPRAPSAIRGTPDLFRSDDTTPLGANLRAILLIGAKASLSKRVDAGGLNLGAVDPVFESAIRARLAPFVGQPLTRKLISDIQASIAEIYRDAGRPFVSVTIPPQEVTSGILNLRVFEFRLGSVAITGADPEQERYILGRVRLTAGEPIDARRLETDLDWLNRSNPAYRVEAVFGPGRDLAITNLTLQVTTARPIQAFAGYSNTGTRGTDRDRWFVGATGSPMLGVLASYQATGSKDYWVNDGKVVSIPDSARYVSHAGRIELPLWARTSFEMTGDYVQTNERSDALFRTRTRTTELSGLYRTSLSNFSPALTGDWLAGAEIKRQHRVTFFAEQDVAHGAADVFQLVTGWAERWADRYGTNTLDMRLKHNPGNVMPLNTAADWNSFTNGRVNDIHTTLVTANFSRVMPLGSGFVWSAEAIGLYANKPLPDTERIAIGGAQTVRGYVTEDGAADQAAILRDTIYLPSFSIAQLFGAQTSSFTDQNVPFAFVDVGWGRDMDAARDQTLASIGAGIDQQIGPWFRSSLAVAYALRDGTDTQAGAWRLHARAVVSY
jgi:hemolysin activation/secretion protein